MRRQGLIRVLAFVAVVTGFVLSVGQAQEKSENPTGAEIRKSIESLVKSFNAAKADELAAHFLPQGELVDEAGNLYQGQKDLSAAFATFFKAFPGAKLTLAVDSVRLLGPNLAIDEGVRVVTAGKEMADRAQMRYVAVWSKGTDGKWLVASLRESSDDPLPTHNERLQGLAWMVGDWVSEEADGKVAISFRWSEDKNYLLGDYQIQFKGKAGMKSTQRIGWDPVSGRVRSWLFDADGAFSEGVWTATDSGWIVKSTGSNPDGSAGSATLLIKSIGDDRFSIKGTHRVVGEQPEPDFEFTIARRPPAAAK